MMEEKNSNIYTYVVELYKKKWWIVLNFILISIFAYVNAFFLATKEYKSQVVFLPPTSSGGSASLGNLIPGFPNIGSLFNNEISPDQISIIFSSKAIKRKIIDRYNLLKYFKVEKDPNKFELACKNLDKLLLLSADEKGGFGFSSINSFTISCFHKSPDTALQIVEYTFYLLDSTVQAISSNQGKRNREFTEKQLLKQQLVLDSMRIVFRNFQIEHKAYDIPEQLRITLNAYADIKAMEISNQLKIDQLKNTYGSETPEILELNKKNKSISALLEKFESGVNPNVSMPLRLSSELMAQYTDMYRNIEIQNKLILLLKQEHEQAKLKEAKDISSLVITDPAYKATYKSRPKRIILMALFIFPYMFFCVLMILYLKYYKTTIKESLFLKNLRKALSAN